MKFRGNSIAVAALITFFGCASTPERRGPSTFASVSASEGVEAEASPTPLPPPAAGEVELMTIAQPSAANAWVVTPRGIGALQLGASPARPAAGWEASYTTGFYADAQPLEGFRFDDPPVTAYIEGGPFARWGMDHPGEDSPAALKQRAAKLAGQGKLQIRMIVVTDPRPKTEAGIGVGDSYSKLKQKFPGLGGIESFPGLWEEPSCVVTLDQTLWYFFDSCQASGQAKVTRIAVMDMQQDEEESDDFNG